MDFKFRLLLDMWALRVLDGRVDEDARVKQIEGQALPVGMSVTVSQAHRAGVGDMAQLNRSLQEIAAAESP
eukprot:scaffold439_cov415-Prasinococcus_capsulatus_cf.AAC.10